MPDLSKITDTSTDAYSESCGNAATEISVVTLQHGNAAAAIVTTNIAFRESEVITQVPLPGNGAKPSDKYYMPWGANNMLPYSIIDKFEEDETLAACADFQSEVCYASGLQYKAPEHAFFASEIEDFFEDNDMTDYFLGVCKDIKRFEFAVSVLIIDQTGKRITNIYRKEACYCRFAPAKADGTIEYIVYANWRFPVSSPDHYEIIPLLDSRCLRTSLIKAAAAGIHKVAVVTRVPGIDSMYYPIPTYGSLFRGKWYTIKKLIGIAKEAKLRNSAPIKYLIEVSQKYWDNLFKARNAVTAEAKNAVKLEVQQDFVDFLTGAKNSGKALFSSYFSTPEGKEIHDVRITKIETDKEGGDWASDHAEAINMICFAMRVHSNLVGSVPGKSQTNNSGSDKRELYIIAQALQTPYRQLLYRVHKLIINFNGWHGTKVEVPLLQLTTLDEHTDAKEVSAERTTA